jgi:predicted ArsR family transcriptional regulator
MPAHRERHTRPNALPSIPAEAALSFLKDTKGALNWSARDFADTLKINQREAEQVLAFLQAQGYVQPARHGEVAQQRQPSRGTNDWITTPAGETVAGAKPPRFTRESVEQALVALKDRINQSNKDPQAPFRITDAVAFGDFLSPIAPESNPPK